MKKRLVEALAVRLAYLLPRRVVKWCAIRLLSHACAGPWSHEEVPAVPAVTALRRWPA